MAISGIPGTTPPAPALGSSIRGEVEEGQAFHPRNIPFQLLRPVGILAKDKSPGSLCVPHSIVSFSALALLHRLLLRRQMVKGLGGAG
jgi:hypothetical protein